MDIGVRRISGRFRGKGDISSGTELEGYLESCAYSAACCKSNGNIGLGKLVLFQC